MDPWMSSNRNKSEEYFVDKWFYLLSSRQHIEGDHLGIGISFFFLMFILFLRERVCAHKQGRSREKGDRGSEVGSMLTAETPMQGSNSWTARSGSEPKSYTQPTKPPRRPQDLFLCKSGIIGWAKSRIASTYPFASLKACSCDTRVSRERPSFE